MISDFTIKFKNKNQKRMSTITTFVQHSIRNPTTAIRQDKKSKNPNWKRSSKTVTVSRWKDTIYRKP